MKGYAGDRVRFGVGFEGSGDNPSGFGLKSPNPSQMDARGQKGLKRVNFEVWANITEGLNEGDRGFGSG